MLKKIFLVSLVFLGAAVGYSYLSYTPEKHSAIAGSLPWDIEVSPDGNYSRVFGLTLGQSPLSDVLALNPEDHELAIISSSDDVSGLEAYFPSFSTGPLSGKLIATIKVEPELMQNMKASASHSAYLETGSRKFLLNADHLALAMDLPLQGLSYIPGVSLSLDVITQRFGQAAETITVDEGTTLLTYPDKGLLITLNKKGKESLQYVPPAEFDQLLKIPEKRVIDQQI